MIAAAAGGSHAAAAAAAAAEVVRARLEAAGAATPEIALVLGTGLGGLAREIGDATVVPYGEIPGFERSTVESHAGRLVVGTLGGRRVAALQGRLHRYEGHALERVVLPIRALGALGARTLVVSNACGAMHPLWDAGDLVLLSDHLNLLGGNPLVGRHDEALGPRFPDLSAPYDGALRALARAAALELGVTLREGVYAAVAGPNLETPAEYRMLRALGADVVGMSTVPEVIAAAQLGMRTVGLSIVTDRCLPDALEPVDIARIVAVATRAEPELTRLIRRMVERMD